MDPLIDHADSWPHRAENVIVMIASSIPMLRSLFIAQKPSYEMHSSDYPSRSATKGSGVKSQVTTRGYHGPDSSEENILPVQGVQGRIGIAKSTTYTVNYETKPDAKA